MLRLIVDFVLNVIQAFSKKNGTVDQNSSNAQSVDSQEKKPKRTNKKGIDLIKSFEGLELKAYKDVVGVLTIGYGHTGSGFDANSTITEAEAEEILKKDLQLFENGVNSAVTVNLNDNQFSALVSFSYNLGLGNLGKSTLLKLVNEGKFQEASEEFGKWTRAGGNILPGLVRRREAEKNLFLDSSEL